MLPRPQEQFSSCSSYNRSQAPAVLAAAVSAAPLTAAPRRPGRRQGTAPARKGLCGIGLLQVQRLFSFQLASALRELLLCGCGGEEVVLRRPLCVNWKSFQQPPNIFFPFDLDSAGESDCIFGKGEHFPYKISPRKFPYGTTRVISRFLAFSCLTQC